MPESCYVIEYEDLRDWKRVLPRVREAIAIMEETLNAYIQPESRDLLDIIRAVQVAMWGDDKPVVTTIEPEEFYGLSVYINGIQTIELYELRDMLEKGPPEYATEC